jgi:hypothetical protein
MQAFDAAVSKQSRDRLVDAVCAQMGDKLLSAPLQRWDRDWLNAQHWVWCQV